ncbi:hypothetical protein PENSUB_5490 [Penicillium subrubescens]|uniref:Uncharacterized protein n=1 Tax=Penicillium subrubescens TaxID=1316194 RepID=A0A1Q5U8T9_9EURO|nr:hypothetical protein PENSUB_5490 [Penicillium subrubescens]
MPSSTPPENGPRNPPRTLNGLLACTSGHIVFIHSMKPSKLLKESYHFLPLWISGRRAARYVIFRPRRIESTWTRKLCSSRITGNISPLTGMRCYIVLINDFQVDVDQV